MTNYVFLRGEEIARCAFGDDAELIFNSYVKTDKDFDIYVKHVGVFGESITHTNLPKKQEEGRP